MNSLQPPSHRNMDINKDHAAIDIKLAETLSKKFKTLHYPSSKECCIYRVPQSQRCLNPSDYTPHIVSIGPLHHGNEELKAMEDNKLRYLHHFLQRTKVSMPEFVASIRKKEARLRNCYAETIDIESDEFVAMILVDAVFLIELFLRKYKGDFRTDDDPLFGESELSFLGIQMRFDLYLEENQLPLFILNELFDLAKIATYGDIYSEISLITIIRFFFSKDSSFLPIGDTNLIDTHFSKAKHFLDLIILCLRPSSQSRDKRRFNYQNIPGIKELHQAGVQFDSGRGRSQSRLHITFENGRLIIPSFTAFGGRTERLYRNILTFENMQGYPRYFNDYVALLCFLIRTPKDADLLIQNGIIGLGDSERMSSVLQSLKKSCIMGSDFQYANVVTDLLHYCKLEWHGWTATLKQNYFNTPWASISVIAGVILLILTVVQTVCALIAL
ncbi:UPF0481 protein At3g47200 [Citrus sinensis]|uniref:Uncharacterized protein n=2 Tax=Citrus sinensis TaxID=2711 RepID=A0A067FBW5_CITSI|nr:UPF0481 protein At3g47200 [Citrus sinensis]KDO64813.1 hypothetical protein CISIN_1g013479mg [Citrus sinensis]